jgi:NADH:ubiquinone oxidoreductase subunit E
MAKTTIKVCGGFACSRRNSKYILERIEAELELIKKNNPKITASIAIEQATCQGNCENGPTVVVEQGNNKKLHSKMNPIKTAELLEKLVSQS